MKNSFILVVALMTMMVCSASSCDKNDDHSNTVNTTENPTPMANGNIKIKVGSKTFTATLYDNSAAKAFRDMLPMAISMMELNGNEKYFDLPKSLPTNASNPGTIQNGDLMLYGSRTLVLFYKGFSTSYSYTRLGRVDNISELVEVLGSGIITVKYELD